MKSISKFSLCAAALLLLAGAQANAGWKDLASAALSGDTATTSAQAALTQAAAQATTTASSQVAYADQIQAAMTAAKSLPTLADIQSGKVTAATFKESVEKLKAVKVDKTPADFQTAYTETVNSAGSAVTLAEKMPSKATVTTKQGLVSALAQAAASDNAASDVTKTLTETKAAFTQLNTSRQKLGTLGAKYLAAAVK